MICEIELNFVLTFFTLVGSSLKSEKLLSEGKSYLYNRSRRCGMMKTACLE